VSSHRPPGSARATFRSSSPTSGGPSPSIFRQSRPMPLLCLHAGRQGFWRRWLVLPGSPGRARRVALVAWHALGMRRIRPIIVLGAERSGTSAWAELIYRWGGYAGGGDELAEPDGLNPHGRWEYGPLWDLLALVGDFAAGVSWWEE